MATKNTTRLSAAKKASPTKLAIKIAEKTIPVFSLPAENIIDATKFIPLFDFTAKASKESLVVRREELMPKAKGAALDEISLQYKFGRTLVDTYTPLYGCRYDSGNGYFAFVNSTIKSSVFLRGWDFEISATRNHNNIFSVGFIADEGKNLYVLKLNFFHTPVSFVLTIDDGQSVRNVLVAAGARSLNIFFILSEENRVPICTLTLKKSLNNPTVAFTVNNLELYESLFLPPPLLLDSIEESMEI